MGPDLSESIDVLVVGAGPTGLTLAAQLHAFAASTRVIDRQLDRVHESRALAIQPRSLELLAGLGLADELVERGNTAVRILLHAGRRVAHVPLFDIGLDDTAYPYLLFLSQSVTEQVLSDHLAGHAVRVDRGVELVGLEQRAEKVRCTVRHRDGTIDRLTARYVVGCDGANSSVRELAGIEFRGGSYPQTFVLADLDADGLEPGAAHVYLSERGLLFFFPLVQPAPWRLLAMAPMVPDQAPGREPPSLADLQALVDAYATRAPHLHDPVWRTYFRLHHRHAAAYRAGRVFLAGDAAHIHSPAGAQGMNTGIQDAMNLGWKLALVTTGTASEALLDTYDAERRPVGRYVVRLTDRAFTIATSKHPLIRLVRGRVVPVLAPLAVRLTPARRYGFRVLAQLAVAYRHSAASHEGTPSAGSGPRAGDRLPDAPLVRDGKATTLHRITAGQRFHLLLTGPSSALSPDELMRIKKQYAGLLDVHRLGRWNAPEGLRDLDGLAHRRLGLTSADRATQHLIRPDGYIAYRAAGSDLSGLRQYLVRWLPGA